MEFPTIWITALTVAVLGIGGYYWHCCYKLKTKMAEIIEWMECMVERDCRQSSGGLGWIQRRLESCGCGTNGGDPPPDVPLWP